jgi:hypothetical protein
MKGDNPQLNYNPTRTFHTFDLNEGYNTELLLDFLAIPPSTDRGDRDGGYDTLPMLTEIRSIEIDGQPHHLLVQWAPTQARPTDEQIRAQY